MIFYKAAFGIWFLWAGLSALSYVRYLHDEEENTSGALAVLLLTLLAGAGVYFIGSRIG